jgi:hypothetical protein
LILATEFANEPLTQFRGYIILFIQRILEPEDKIQRIKLIVKDTVCCSILWDQRVNSKLVFDHGIRLLQSTLQHTETIQTNKRG